MTRKWRGVVNRVAPLPLMAATLVAYLPAIRGGYIWDDDAFVTDNLILRGGWGALWRIWFEFRATDQYYPLTYSTFWIEYHLWGLWPVGSHIVNVLLHATNAWLLWKVLSRLDVPGAWLAALVFAAHPVEVESVAWITERKNVLSATFYLAAALAYLRFDAMGSGSGTSVSSDPSEPAPASVAASAAPLRGRSRARWGFYGLALVLFLCALWSKTVTCTLPAALLIVSWWKRGRVRLKDLLPLLPLFALGAGMGLLTAWMEKHVIGAKGNDWSVTTPQRFLIAGRALWFYLWKLAWPTNLMFIYPRWTLDAHQLWQWCFPAAAVVLAAVLWTLRERLGRAPFAAAAFFAVTLFPALGFVDVYPFRYSFVADHFQYLASVGPIALFGAGIAWLFRFIPRWGGRLFPIFGGVVLLGLGALTFEQCGMYSSIDTLYRTTLRRNPSCWMAHDNLAVRLIARGRTTDAILHCRRSLEIKPDDAAADVNLGNALVQEGRVEEAIEHYQHALNVKPDFPEAESDLGNGYLMLGRFDPAIDHYQRSLTLRPDYAEGNNNLGFALMQTERIDEAIYHFRRALELRPDYQQAQENLAIALARKK